MICIFCNQENDSKSVEHIVSESLGNKDYVMQKGEVCDACNNKFSDFEKKALSNSIFVVERARLGIESKKGSTAKGKIKELTIEGDKSFKEGLINVSGLNKDNLKEFNPLTKEAKLRFKTFDKSEVAASKLFLKIALESIYKSQKKLFSKYNFSDLKDFLTGVNNVDWPFIGTSLELSEFKSVPTFTDKHRLHKTPCRISFSELDEDTLLFKFKYGGADFIINLLNRKLDWIVAYTSGQENICELYPEHYKTKLEKHIAKSEKAGVDIKNVIDNVQ
jgi:hypothetical protein